MKYKNYHSSNGHSPAFNQLYGSLVNFLLKLFLSLVFGDKAAKHSGKLRYRLTGAIANKTINWK